MQLIKHFMADDAARSALNALTRATFGFSFESWYAAGWWAGDYLPYAFEEDGRLLSNVSVNRMRFLLDGQERRFIQLGTVMTDPAYRHQGLASRLMRAAMDDFAGQCDGFYLFGDLGALGFYDQLGFSRICETRYTLRASAREALLCSPAREGGFAPVDPADAAMKARYVELVRCGAPYAALEQLSRLSLTMFYTASMKRVLYAPALDCFAVLERDGGNLCLQSVACARRLPLETVLAYLPSFTGTLTLGFAPCGGDEALFDAQPFDGGEDYRLFILGDALREIETRRLCFPVLSHA